MARLTFTQTVGNLSVVARKYNVDVAAVKVLAENHARVGLYVATPDTAAVGIRILFSVGGVRVGPFMRWPDQIDRFFSFDKHGPMMQAAVYIEATAATALGIVETVLKTDPCTHESIQGPQTIDETTGLPVDA